MVARDGAPGGEAVQVGRVAAAEDGRVRLVLEPDPHDVLPAPRRRGADARACGTGDLGRCGARFGAGRGRGGATLRGGRRRGRGALRRGPVARAGRATGGAAAETQHDPRGPGSDRDDASTARCDVETTAAHRVALPAPAAGGWGSVPSPPGGSGTSGGTLLGPASAGR